MKKKFIISFAATFAVLLVAMLAYFNSTGGEYIAMVETEPLIAAIDIEPPFMPAEIARIEIFDDVIPIGEPEETYEEEPEPEEPPAQVFSLPTYQIDALLRLDDNNIALLYKNLETGFTHTFNADRVFFGASLNKLNHALYVFELAERGLINLNHVHTFTEGDIRSGTGTIQHMEIGTQFTTRELLRHSMIHSDNVAQHMLIRHTSGASFTYADFVQQIGANPNFIGNIRAQNTSVTDKLIWLEAIHNYINSDGAFAHFFRADLLATPGFIMSDYPMARKYGWATASFHDAAIVYTPSPYILIILSDIEEGDATLFANISMRVQRLNREWFE